MDPPPEMQKNSSFLERDLTEAQVAVRADKYYKQLVIGVLLLFCFVDVLGQALFMPAGPILCQQAEGGPVNTYAELLLSPPGAIDFGELGLRSDFTDLFDSLDERARAMGKCPPDHQFATNGNVGCRYGLTLEDTRQLAVDTLGNPRAFQEVPMKYSTATNFLVMLGSVTSGLGQALWGWLSDRIGRKPCMIICQIGGLVSYFLMYLAGSQWNDYWSFAGGLILNGFFSGSFTIVNAYFLDVMSRKEAEGPNNMVMGMSILGGAVGSLILMPFVSGRGARLFDACWVAIACAFLVLALTVLMVPESSKRADGVTGPATSTKGKSGSQLVPDPQDPEAATPQNQELEVVTTKSNSDSSQPPHSTDSEVLTKVGSRILWVCVIGGALDAAGDEGTRIARGTILQNVWPVTNDLMFQNILLLSLIGMLFIVLALVELGKTTIGLGWTTVLGATMTLVTQLLLNAKVIRWESYQSFLGVWYGGKLFGMCSTFASFAVVNEFAPEDAVGTWSGKAQGLSGVAEAVATMAIAILYDANNTGSDDGLRGVVAMFLTAGVSMMAVICYLPLIALVPARAPDEKVLEKKFMTVDQYEKLSDLEYKRLSLEEIDFLETKRMKDGKAPRVMLWGRYQDDIPELEGMIERSEQDFQYIKVSTTKTLTSRAKVQEEREAMKQMDSLLDGTVDVEEQRRMMGEWVTRYLEDAGYHSWWQFPQFYKSMVMNAFPPVHALDGKPVDWDTVDMEDMLLNFLKVADAHVRQSRTTNASMPRSLRMAKSAL